MRLASASFCRQHGAGQKAALLAILAAGRPAGVSMNLKGLAAWSQWLTFINDAWHAFVITGYDTASDGQLIFHTRNSWKGRNPDVREDELCRIGNVYSVEAPNEQGVLAGSYVDEG